MSLLGDQVTPPKGAFAISLLVAFNVLLYVTRVTRQGEEGDIMGGGWLPYIEIQILQ